MFDIVITSSCQDLLIFWQSIVEFSSSVKEQSILIQNPGLLTPFVIAQEKTLEIIQILFVRHILFARYHNLRKFIIGLKADCQWFGIAVQLYCLRLIAHKTEYDRSRKWHALKFKPSVGISCRAQRSSVHIYRGRWQGFLRQTVQDYASNGMLTVQCNSEKQQNRKQKSSHK